MKRLIVLFLAGAVCLGLVLPAAAQSQAGQLSTQALVDRNGICAVTLTATVTYDEPVTSPVFPIPAGAESVVLGGSPATVYNAASARWVSLKDVTRGNAGTFSFTIGYTLHGVVAADEEGDLILTLELLSGFTYPMEGFQAEIRLPGEVTHDPTFTSGYYQTGAEDRLRISVQGDTIAISSLEQVKDHETLVMTLPVEGRMFPGAARTARVLGTLDLLLALAVLVAAVYYLIVLRPKLPRRPWRPTAPDGISAGDLPTWIMGAGRDLTMLVVTWARLGYLRIVVEDTGRVVLHKRMDMGNERSPFENRCYKNLFGRRKMVDATGEHYARLVRAVGRKVPPLGEIYRTKPRDVKIFQALSALSGVLSGVAIAGALAAHSTWLMVLLGLAGGAVALAVQAAGRCLLLRDRRPLALGLVCALLWLVLGVWSGEWIGAVPVLAYQFLAGIGVAYGGKRTPLGQQALKEILGLRRFMGKVSKRELQQYLKNDPGYFHDLAPYALALGVDKRFARRFGRLRLPECTYLIQSHQRLATAGEWAQLLRQTVKDMDAKAHRLPLDRLRGR